MANARYPTCPCQSGLTEFRWTDVGYLGTLFHGVRIFRCEDCNRSAFHVPAASLFFYRIDKSNPTFETLSYVAHVCMGLYVSRQNAQERDVSVRLPEPPSDMRVFTLVKDTWIASDGALRMSVPRDVPTMSIGDEEIHFFLHPPRICKSQYDAA